MLAVLILYGSLCIGRQGHNGDRACLLNLLPSLGADAELLGNLGGCGALAQQLLPAGMQIPPGGRHLDRKARITQIVHDLAVGVGASVGAKRATAGGIEALGGLEQSDDCHLAQILERVDGASGEVAGDRVGQIEVLQRQGVGGRTPLCQEDDASPSRPLQPQEA